jgi:glycosyltransferase involved in cell wall biosynthesis
MNSEQPLLTIGIPTWNRSRELQQCIQIIASQIDAVSEDVEIFVSDNASDDETAEMLCGLASKIKYLRYSRNESNIGPDLNFLKVFKEASGKYLWLFSDDDFVVDGAVAEMLRIIRSYEPAHISTNFLLCDGNKTIADVQPQKRFLVEEDLLHADINKTFMVRNHWISFISCNVFRRDLMDFDEFESHADKLRNWIQVYVVAYALSKNPDCYLSSFNAVLLRTGNSSFNSFGFVKSMPEAFSHTFNGFGVDKHVARQIMKEIRAAILPFRSFLAYRSLGVVVSPLLIPEYYKLAYLFPKTWVLIAWKTKHFICGRGFSLPENIRLS